MSLLSEQFVDEQFVALLCNLSPKLACRKQLAQNSARTSFTLTDNTSSVGWQIGQPRSCVCCITLSVSIDTQPPVPLVFSVQSSSQCRRNRISRLPIQLNTYRRVLVTWSRPYWSRTVSSGGTQQCMVTVCSTHTRWLDGRSGPAWRDGLLRFD